MEINKEKEYEILEGKFEEDKLTEDNFNNDEYRKFFEEDNFWEKIKKFATKIGVKGIYYALILYYILQRDDISIQDKALIVGALGYLIAPIDLIPDLLLGIGFVDDIAALTIVIKKLNQYIDEDIKNKAKIKLQDWFSELDEDLEKYI